MRAPSFLIPFLCIPTLLCGADTTQELSLNHQSAPCAITRTLQQAGDHLIDGTKHTAQGANLLIAGGVCFLLCRDLFKSQHSEPALLQTAAIGLIGCLTVEGIRHCAVGGWHLSKGGWKNLQALYTARQPGEHPY